MSNVVKTGAPVRVSASGVIRYGNCNLIGVIVNSTTSGTITLYDEVSATGTAFVAAIAPAAGVYTPIPASCAKGIYFTLANTMNVTFFVAD